MKVKVEIETCDSAKVTVFDETVSEEWQLSQLWEILTRALNLERKLSDYIENMPEEDKNERSNCL